MELFVFLGIIVVFGLFMCWLCGKVQKDLEASQKRQQEWRDAHNKRMEEHLKRMAESNERIRKSASRITGRPHEERVKEFWDAKKPAPVAPGPVRRPGSSKNFESSYPSNRNSHVETDYVTPMIIAHSLSSSSSYSDDTSSRICSSSSSSSYNDSSSSYSSSSSDSSSSCSSSSDY